MPNDDALQIINKSLSRDFDWVQPEGEYKGGEVFSCGHSIDFTECTGAKILVCVLDKKAEFIDEKEFIEYKYIK